MAVLLYSVSFYSSEFAVSLTHAYLLTTVSSTIILEISPKLTGILFYSTYYSVKRINPFSAGTDFRRQNLTSIVLSNIVLKTSDSDVLKSGDRH